MGKSEKKKLKLPKSSLIDEEPNPPIVVSSDDDEANEDLSLKIVQKAISRASSNGGNRKIVFDVDEDGSNGFVVNLSSSSEPEVVTGSVRKKKKKEKSLPEPEAEPEVVTDDRVSKRKKKEKSSSEEPEVVTDDCVSKRKNKEKSSSEEAEVVTDDCVSKRKKKEKKKKMKGETVEARDDAVDVAEIEQEAGTSKSVEAETSLETNPVEKADNVVLRKLLRGPRYFDPPDSNWGNCYNCGEEGHTTANCTSARRKKPCFVCGSLEHNVKQCKKGRDCFICKKGGHRAKDCPEKSFGGSQNAKICLKCGDYGHDMFSCWNDYSADDLKEIQCYICKCFGHLCCANTGTGPEEVSCYKCGQSGHTGLACTRLRGESTGNETPSSCYRCGEEGHFARECATAVKSAKRNRELSNYKEAKKKRKEVKSAPPQDHDKAYKRKKVEYEGVASSSKAKKRGGWITEDPGDVLPQRIYKPKNNGYNSPVTPTNRASRIPNYGSPRDYASSPYYYNSGRKLQFGNSASNGPPVHYYHPHSASSNGPPQYYHHHQQHHHRYSASRFGNSGNDGPRQYWPNNNSNYWY